MQQCSSTALQFAVSQKYCKTSAIRAHRQSCPNIFAKVISASQRAQKQTKKKGNNNNNNKSYFLRLLQRFNYLFRPRLTRQVSFFLHFWRQKKSAAFLAGFYFFLSGLRRRLRFEINEISAPTKKPEERPKINETTYSGFVPGAIPSEGQRL